MIYEKIGHKLFSKFLTKDFPVNGNYFPFDLHFTAKQTPANLKNRKIFYSKTNEASILENIIF
jgi:hypothetical protein